MATKDQHHIFQWYFIDINHCNFHSYSHGLFLILLFINIFFFITILFLCIEVRRHHFTESARMASPALTPACQWVGIVEYTYSMHNPLTVSAKSLDFEANFEISECCICLSAFQEEEKLKVLQECGHVYHSECLDKWLSTNPSCPLCRVSLVQVYSQGKSTISN